MSTRQTYRRVLPILALVFMLAGCAGQMAQVNLSMLHLEGDYGFKVKNPITFSTAGLGEQTYTGHPSSLGYGAYSVTVDLKSIQDASAKAVLGSIYDEVRDAGANSQIISYITDFKYLWLFSLTTKVDVSFNLHFKAVTNGNVVYTNIIPVKDIEDTGKIDWSGAFGLLGEVLSGSIDERSQLVGDVTLKAVYDIYKTELTKIAKKLE